MDVEELERHLRDVIARVRAGETVEIAEEGKPVARIAPCRPVWEQALGVRPATRQMRDFQFERIRLMPGPDLLEVLEEVRGDRDLLP